MDTRALFQGEHPTPTGHVTDDLLRAQVLKHSKDFKLSWVKLGQALYSIYNDKIYKLWGYEKFESYTEKEIGLKKVVAMKLLKTYYFLEHEEPSYLKEDYPENTVASKLPSCDTVNVLRLAKNNKELNREDYQKLKEDIFIKGKDAITVRKDLTAIMKERKEVDPDEERDKRNEAAMRRFLNAVRSFKRDIEVLKLTPPDLIKQTEELLKRLELEVTPVD